MPPHTHHRHHPLSYNHGGTIFPCLLETSFWSQAWKCHKNQQSARAMQLKAKYRGAGKTHCYPLVHFLPLRRAFIGIESIRNFGDCRKQCYMLHSSDRHLPPFPSHLPSWEWTHAGQEQKEILVEELGQMVIFGCISNESVTLLSIVRAEDLPLVTPPTLLGLVLPEWRAADCCQNSFWQGVTMFKELRMSSREPILFLEFHDKKTDAPSVHDTVLVRDAWRASP